MIGISYANHARICTIFIQKTWLFSAGRWSRYWLMKFYATKPIGRVQNIDGRCPDAVEWFGVVATCWLATVGAYKPLVDREVPFSRLWSHVRLLDTIRNCCHHQLWPRAKMVRTSDLALGGSRVDISVGPRSWNDAREAAVDVRGWILVQTRRSACMWCR